MAKYSESQLKKKLSESPFPVEQTNPEEKNKYSYGKQIANYIYFKGISQDLASNRRMLAQENRDYATNRNDINKYKPLLDASIDNKGDTSYLVIDWSNQHPGKKFADTIIGDMMNLIHKIQFNAIDPNSKAKFRKDRDKFYGEIVRKRDIAAMEAESGLVLEKRADFNPLNKEDVDIFMDLEYKQAIEIGMESIVSFELEDNDWDKKVKKRVIRDFVENNMGAVRLSFDKNNKIALRYVDAPLSFYTSFTDEPDSSNSEYEAEIVYMSIRELRRKDIDNKVTEEQWFQIARENSSKYGNRKWNFGQNYDISGVYGGQSYSYDDFRIEVLDFIFYSIDKLTYSEKKDKFGGTHLEKKQYGYKKPKRSKKDIEVLNTELEMSYEGFWVSGSDILVGYGRSKNIMRPKSGKAFTPSILHRYITFQPNMRNGSSKSMIEVIRPNLDTIQMLVLRKRHLIAEVTPSGVAVDVTGISDVMAALKETDPMKIVKLYKQKGILFYSRTDVNGDPANGMPVQELNNPFAEQLMAIDQSILSEITLMQQNSGINDARDGSSPDKDALVGIEKMRLLASNNTTREIYKGFTDGILAPIGRVMARMIQYKVEYGGGIEEYEGIIGELGVKSVEFAKDITMAQLGIIVEALPTDAQIQDLLDVLTMSLKNKEIRPEDFFEVKRIPNIKKAERILSYRRKKFATEQMEEFAQKEQITSEREAASAAAAAEAQKVKDASEAEKEMKVNTHEYTLKGSLDDKMTMNKLKVIDRENYHKEHLLEIQQEDDDDEGIVNMPKINQNPGGAIERTTEI